LGIDSNYCQCLAREPAKRSTALYKTFMQVAQVAFAGTADKNSIHKHNRERVAQRPDVTDKSLNHSCIHGILNKLQFRTTG